MNNSRFSVGKIMTAGCRFTPYLDISCRTVLAFFLSVVTTIYA
jgi:hypothetical protein